MTKPRSTTAEEPAISVSAPATSPPVQDSAVATMSFLALHRSSRAVAAACGLRVCHLPGPGQPHRGGRHRGDAFLAAGEAELLAGRGLHRDALDRHLGDLGDPLSHRVAVRPDARRLADDGDIEMRDPAAALVTRSTANFRNWSDDAPRQRGSLGEKCLPMSPSASAPRIASTSACERDVGIRMTGQPAVVRNLDAAEPDMIAVAEGMHVEAVAEAQVGQAGDPPRLGLGEILVGGELHVAAFSRECCDLDARPFGQRGVVGEIVAAFLGGALMRLEQRPKI